MRIYLAVPYNHESAEVREARFNAVNVAAGRLMRAGHHVYSPISHSHPIAKVCDLPLGWDYWEAVDRSFIEWADAVYVLMLDGWKASPGVSAEIEIARSLGKLTVFVE